MVQSTEYIPTKEVRHTHTPNVLFGVCCECGNPINYAPVKIPRTCTEVENWKEAGVGRYSVEYADYHVCCAVKSIIKRDGVDIFVNLEYPFMSKLEWVTKLINRWIKDPKVSIEVDTYKSHPNFSPNKTE